MRTDLDAFRHAARIVVDSEDAPDAAVLSVVDTAQQALVTSASLSWRISSGHVEHGKQRMLAALETVGGSEAATTPQAPRRRREEQDQR